MPSELGAMRAAAVIGISVVWFTACWPFNQLEDCDLNPNLPCYWVGKGSPTGGGDGGTPPGCVPSEGDAPVDNECGVFVSSSASDDGGDGTKEKPLKTLAAAVAMAPGKAKPVYACAETFKEALVLDGAVEVYGGLECAKGWGYGGGAKKTTLTAASGETPLAIKGSANGARVEDFVIRGADAVTDGGSSIAVLADGGAAELVRCELLAGNGARGTAGTPGDPNGMPAMSGMPGNKGVDACSDLDATPGPDAMLSGGALITNDCAGGELSVGGKGGDGNIPIGGDGSAGQTGTAGQAGTGEPSMGGWSCTAGSGLGNGGSPGENGMPGSGATGSGTISSSGYTGTSGGAGTSGKAGQGGGGGGGAKGGMICSGNPGSGASGGSGGAGGCGGLPGQGGGPGGASIALVSLNASITLTDCTLSSSNGGDGGAGGDAQPGGDGGLPGVSGKGAGLSNPACSGGQGGKGGAGGPGGGGLGGTSLGIAFQGDPPETKGETTVKAGTPGAGGLGGNTNIAMNQGKAGVAAEEQKFP